MKITVSIVAGKRQEAAETIAGFLRDQLGAVAAQSESPVESAWRGPTSEMVVLVATVLQGAAAALYLLKELDAKERITALLKHIRSLVRPGESVTLQIEDRSAIDLLKSRPERVLEELRYRPPGD